MDFDYETTYKPTDAKIVLKGELTFVAEDSKKIMELWEKEKKLEEKISLPILNYLLKFCAVECVKIADDLKLPVPVQLPEIRAKK